MLKSICFFTTYQCNAKCDYCECGPEVSLSLDKKDVIDLIDEAFSLGTIKQVIFTGGEPLLLGDDLFECIEYSHKKGLLTRVVTNGFWAKTKRNAVEIVCRLIKSGLTEINISVDDLHQEWIPLDSVKNAFWACYDNKLNCLIAHKHYRNSKITKKFIENYFGIKLINFKEKKKYKEEQHLRLISTGVIVPVGREPKRQAEERNFYYGLYTDNCDSILQDIIIGADKKMLACCGIVTKNIPELILGDMNQDTLINSIIRADQDLLLNWLALEGPYSIAEFIKKKAPDIQFKDNYVNKCDLCNDIFTRSDAREILKKNIKEKLNYISLHRKFLEFNRGSKKYSKLYVNA